MKLCIWCVFLIAILFASPMTFGAIILTGGAESDHSEGGSADADFEGGSAGADADGGSPYNWGYAEGWKRFHTTQAGFFHLSWSISGSAGATIWLSSFEACSTAAAGSAHASGKLGGAGISPSASVDSGEYEEDNPMTDEDEPEGANADGWVQCSPDEGVSTSYGGAAYASVIEESDDTGSASIELDASCSMGTT